MPRLTRSAAKDLQRLPEPLRAKAKEIIGRLDEEPSLGKKLRGHLDGKRSTRLGRSHRIVYMSTPSEIVVMAVKQRKDAYR